jgi:hypothetical protein
LMLHHSQQRWPRQAWIMAWLRGESPPTQCAGTALNPDSPSLLAVV